MFPCNIPIVIYPLWAYQLPGILTIWQSTTTSLPPLLLYECEHPQTVQCGWLLVLENVSLQFGLDDGFAGAPLCAAVATRPPGETCERSGVIRAAGGPRVWKMTTRGT